VVTDEILTFAENTMHNVSSDLDVELVEFNAETDHVHLLVAYLPTMAISTLVQRLNGRTAQAVRRHEFIGRCVRARMRGHLWSPSYFAVTCGGAPLSIIEQYIVGQAHPIDARHRAEWANAGLRACAQEVPGHYALPFWFGALWRTQDKTVGRGGEALAQGRQPRREVGVEVGKFDSGRADRAGVQGVAGGVDVQLTHGVIGYAQAALLQRANLGEDRVDRGEGFAVVLQLAHQGDQGVPRVAGGVGDLGVAADHHVGRVLAGRRDEVGAGAPNAVRP
jgi:putative transposase